MKRIALAGNPNCGKTTLFNILTGSNQYVGNWPGVTVEKKAGKLKGNKDIQIIDLPGIYSLSPYSLDEVVARNYLIDEKPDLIINIVDASNLERNLYLTTQLLETKIPMIIALNMMDIVKANGDKIDIKKLENKLNTKVVGISALKNEGSKELIQAVNKLVDMNSITTVPSFYEGSLKKAYEEVKRVIAPAIKKQDQLDWYAIKYLEQDEEVVKMKLLNNRQQAKVNEICQKLEQSEDDDCESIIANARYEFIEKLVKQIAHKGSKGLSISDRIDRIVTNRILALPIFVLIMFVVYYITVSTIGTYVTDWTNDVLVGEIIQGNVTNFLTSLNAADWVLSLVVDGIIGGLGAPIGFLPQMAILFLFLSILEDCGYMARVAFIMDRIFRKFGLSGKSFIPFMISSGCGVPAIMGTKTIENEKDRRMTMITTTFVPCGAKLPVIALIAGAFFQGAGWVSPLIYFVGIASIIVCAIILKKTKMFEGDPAPFIMELPQYHLPSIKNVLLHVWDRVFSFIKKAGTILFVCCVVMWFLASFGIDNTGLHLVSQEESLLATIGGWIAPLFAPLGFGNWQAAASSLSGFVAKEGIVSTMGIVAGVGELAEDDPSLWSAMIALFPSALAAFSFLLFNLLNSPCLAAISTLAKEMNSKRWTAFALIFQNVFAYSVSLMLYQIGSLLMGGAFTIWSLIAILVLLVFIYLLFRPNVYKEKVSTKLAQA